MVVADERLVDALPALVLVASGEGRVRSCNRRWTDYTGMSVEAVRDGWTEAVHVDDRSRVVELVRRAFVSSSVDAELRLQSTAGEWRWFALRIAPYAATPFGSDAVLLFFDVHASHEREQLLSASERDARLLINSIPGLVATMRPDGEVEFVNEPLLERLGQSLEQLKTWGSNGTIHPDDVETVGEAWTRALASGGPYDIEHRIRCADGQFRWFQVRGRAERDPKGNVIRWYNVISDINTQKSTEERLRRSEARLSQALNAARIGTWSFDLASHTLSISSAEKVLQTFGVTSGGELAAGMLQMIHPDDRDRVRSEFERCVRESVRFQLEYRIALPDGSIRHHRSSGSPLYDERGSMVEFIGTGVDVTEQTVARRALEDAVTALGASERELKPHHRDDPGLRFLRGTGRDDHLRQPAFARPPWGDARASDHRLARAGPRGRARRHLANMGAGSRFG